jgi:hypothetical protein
MSDAPGMLARMNHETLQKAPSRWSGWVERARVCFQIAGAIDATAPALRASMRKLEGASDTAALEAAEALRAAEAALLKARAAVRTAMEAHRLTPANREPVYGVGPAPVR